ncbi:MAG TPA: protein kinase [Thermomonospora sp.]|nr:protein kinase [Thermomonospora sp.]
MVAQPLRPEDPRQIGSYRLQGRLGGGGMGQVFLGRSPGGRPVAVKLVLPGLAADPGFRRRFAQEVDAARRVGGFHTAQVVDADPEADPPWLVTAYVPGPSLQGAVETHGPLPERTVRALGAGLAEGLAAIHACGLVHRDLKPGNVILAEDGPRIIDFGIARVMDGGTMTAAGAVMGTPGFMSPEQAGGATDLGPASDVFALGSVLTYAATGEGPFDAGSVASVVYRIIREDPDLGPIPASLRDLIAVCLAKNPADRPGVADVLRYLADAADASDTWLPPTITAMIAEHHLGTPTDPPSPPLGPAAPAPGTPGSATPGPAIPGSATPGYAMPGPMTPGSGTPGAGAAGHAMPGFATPGHGVPASGTPSPLAPDPLTPSHMTPEHAPPGSASPGHIAPGSVSPGLAAPGSAAPGPATPPGPGAWDQGWTPGAPNAWQTPAPYTPSTPTPQQTYPNHASSSGNSARMAVAAVAALSVVVLAIVGVVVFLSSGDSEGSGNSANSSPPEGGTNTSALADPPNQGAPATAVVGEWKGTYTCTQGLTNISLNITESANGGLEATFRFSPHPSNPSVPSGAFAMKGTFNGGVLDLNGDHWIQQPPGYLMVDLKANVSEPRPMVINGEVDSTGSDCSTFSIRRP